MSLSKPRPSVSMQSWDGLRQHIHWKYNVRVPLESCADDDLKLLHLGAQIRKANGSTCMNPAWFAVVQHLLLLSPAQAAEKYYMYHFAGSGQLLRYPSEQNVQSLRALPQEIINCIIRLAELGISVGLSMDLRSCGFCDMQFSHHSIHCPKYPTFNHRIEFLGNRCQGCASSDCNLGRKQHEAPQNKYLCERCQSNTHIEVLCDNPCSWTLWRKIIKRYYHVAIATQNWSSADFKTFFELYSNKFI